MSLARLAELCGVERAYHDIYGKRREASEETLRALLGAMRLPVENAAQITESIERIERLARQRRLPPVHVATEGMEIRIDCIPPADSPLDGITWKIHGEDGSVREGRAAPADVKQRILRIAEPPSPGYHRLEVDFGENERAAADLIVAPERCYEPAALESDGRLWGMTTSLYSLRAEGDWGIGDFTALRALVDDAADLGADLIGLNPLHALFPHNPHHVSPYSPSSRLFKSFLYLDIPAIPDFAECEEARRRVAAPEFQERLDRARAASAVDYPAVHSAKREVLELLYRSFRQRHRDDERAAAFARYRESEGGELQRHALYEALQEHFHAQDPEVWGWPLWPVSYRHPATPEVAAFAEEHAERVGFFAYVQWQVDRQLAEAGLRSAERHLGIGLCEDLAVGIDSAGADAWANQEQFAIGVGIGAPPDPFNPEGQDWGLPPFVPIRLRETGYRLFTQMLRHNMRHSGALRIDHILGLMRQFWVPAGRSPREGTYVRFPFEDLLGILALESRRNRCLVIGEDLGTIPDGLREGLM
ncbi:MAG: 4-alpha-glucanotransferase, partial [Candidatus Eisenbacteria bacterium]|nr:4-alpha-glucanotransferase [Candidatus Latescibacterota bacterium]MBD3302099.1 4-alpha-glucanotransferase [Candidatus Eisenbacteria bacterium]